MLSIKRNLFVVLLIIWGNSASALSASLHRGYLFSNDSAQRTVRLSNKQSETLMLLNEKEKMSIIMAALNRQNREQANLLHRQYFIITIGVFTLAICVTLMVFAVKWNLRTERLNGLLRQKSNRVIQQKKCIEEEKALLERKTNRLEFENTIAHFEVLKTRVNPHMMFNALAMLKSIIGKNEKDACDFVDDLSNVFRQGLQLKNDLLVTVEEELDFVKSYLRIITKQHENCFMIDIDVPDMINACFIPPFSLQLVVENAIKHNEFCEKNPMRIKIFYEDQTIYITNTLTKKRMEVISTGTGHQNLIDRYKLLSGKGPLFLKDDTLFSVRLPLFIDE